MLSGKRWCEGRGKERITISTGSYEHTHKCVCVYIDSDERFVIIMFYHFILTLLFIYRASSIVGFSENAEEGNRSSYTAHGKHLKKKAL